MTIVSIFAAALLAAPALAAGHGGGHASGRVGRAGGLRSGRYGASHFSRPLSSSSPLGRAVTRSSASGSHQAAVGAAGAGGFAGVGAHNRFASPNGTSSDGTWSCGPGCTAGPSAPGTPGPVLTGSLSHTVGVSDPGPAAAPAAADPSSFLQAVNANPVAVGGGGITYAAHPDTPPGGGKAGGNGSSPNP